MIRFPTTLLDVPQGVVRAGGTDLTDRRRIGHDLGDLVDLRDVQGLGSIAVADGVVRIGASSRIAELAANLDVIRHFPALAAAAGGLATPAIRSVGTVGGNVLQRTRCWYFRDGDVTCLKKGGSRCYAREGLHPRHSCFDLGPCLSVHPSTLACALLLWSTEVELHGAEAMSLPDLLGSPTDPTRDHALPPDAVLVALHVPVPPLPERGAYFRAITRVAAEWPIVECAVRLQIVDGAIALAAVAVGGVSPRPLRLPDVEQALIGRRPSAEVFEAAARRAGDKANPTEQTAWKVPILVGTVQTTLERAMEA